MIVNLLDYTWGRMTDTIATIGRSIVHHGSLNTRVYLMTLHPEDVPWIVAQ